MITPDWARMMARYNGWQNAEMLRALDGVTDAARRADRGLFFGSLHGTVSHLLWSDHVWLSRFTDRARPDTRQAESADYVTDWASLVAARARMDDEIAAWADAMDPGFLARDYSWRSGSAGAEMSRPMAQIVTHIFNHQTHHRGQIHGVLTGLGARTGDTDLFLLTEAA